MSGWNGSGNAGKKAAAPVVVSKKPPRAALGIVAGVVTVIAVATALYFCLSPEPSTKVVPSPKKTALAETVKPAEAPKGEGETRSEKVRKVKQDLNDQVKEFVKKSTGTNNITWIVPPLAPDDPDRALQTRVTQELGSLLSVEPGEPMPPFPYSFLLEDDMKARGEDVSEVDNGNKLFLESLQKFKIQAKETDDEHRLAHKQKLIEAQGDLLAGIDQGISVNDSIRAAYEFRKRAYEMRSTIIKTLTELHEKDGDTEGTVRQIKDLNNKLAEEGIKKISVGEVIEDYDIEEGDAK